MDWVLDWDRILNLLVVLTPFFGAVGIGCKFLLDRYDRRDVARRTIEAEERKAQRDEEERRRRAEREAREAELEEMREARDSFYQAVRAEAERSATNAQRMRELYEAELERAISLRTALAEAAQRETALHETIVQLNNKIDRLQREVATLTERLKGASHARTER